MSIRVFSKFPLGDQETVTLDGDEFHYLIHVRRGLPGSSVVIQGSDGVRRRGVVESVSDETVTLRLGAEETGATVWPVDIVCAVPRRNVMDALVRQLNEIGVRRFVPITTARSVVDPGPQKVERWRRIAHESIRQCGRALPLEISDPLPLSEALAANRWDRGLVAHTGTGAVPFAGQAEGRQAGYRDLACFCGPEGGFSDAEIDDLTSVGFQLVSLGESILRVETAAFACGVLGVGLVGGFGRGSLITSQIDNEGLS